jgi:hypothetical protein
MQMFTEHFYYEHGQLFYKSSGKVAGWFDRGCGYWRVKFKGKTYLVHRIIYYLCYGHLPNFVDHIDRNKTNNWIVNLRGCDKKGYNTVNSEPRADNTSGYKGVTWHKNVGKWHASVFKDGKRHYVGVFECKHEAARAYNLKAVELFGEFAFLNNTGVH